MVQLIGSKQELWTNNEFPKLDSSYGFKYGILPIVANNQLLLSYSNQVRRDCSFSKAVECGFDPDEEQIRVSLILPFRSRLAWALPFRDERIHKESHLVPVTWIDCSGFNAPGIDLILSPPGLRSGRQVHLLLMDPALGRLATGLGAAGTIDIAGALVLGVFDYALFHTSLMNFFINFRLSCLRGL